MEGKKYIYIYQEEAIMAASEVHASLTYEVGDNVPTNVDTVQCLRLLYKQQAGKWPNNLSGGRHDRGGVLVIGKQLPYGNTHLLIPAGTTWTENVPEGKGVRKSVVYAILKNYTCETGCLSGREAARGVLEQGDSTMDIRRYFRALVGKLAEND